VIALSFRANRTGGAIFPFFQQNSGVSRLFFDAKPLHLCDATTQIREP